MTSTLFIIQIVLAILITILVLLQKSSSIGLGAYSGSNESVFGAKGPAGFLTKATFALGLLFVINTLALGYLYSQENSKSAVDVVKNEIPTPATKAKPFVPTAPTNSSANETQKATSDTNGSANGASKATTDANVSANGTSKATTTDKNGSALATKDSADTNNSATKASSSTNSTSVESKTSEAKAKDENSTNSTKDMSNGSEKSATADSANASNAKSGADIEAEIASVLKEHKIKFESDSAMLTPDSIETVKAIVEILRKQPDIKVEIGGYTDNDGNAEYNKKLSQERVDAVKKALVDFGIKADNLKAVGYGSANPLVPNDSAKNKAKNRRVEFRVIK